MSIELKVAGGTDLSVSDAFGRDYNEALIHQVVTAYMAAGRAGTKAQLNRAAVRGGGAKPWRQKGTGRARAGTTRGPIWVGGGRTFAAVPRSFKQKVNRKMYKGAMQSLVSELVRSDRLKVVDTLSLDEPKTKLMVSKLSELGSSNALILVEAFDENVFLAARNIPHVAVMEVSAVDPVSLLRHEHVIMTVAAVKRLEEKLA
ncbi:MAG: 50S ribosomal protein L4 [Gammaproteobacteria bacterium]